MFDFTEARTNMVDSQLRPNGITDARILNAMQNVLRESFVTEGSRDIAYMDGNVPLNGAATNRYLMEPMAFAKMAQLADIKASDKVLEIGSATGYGTTVLRQLSGQVVAVEQDQALLALAKLNLAGMVNLTLIENALAAGWAKAAPYDVILISGSVETVPEVLFSQLSEGGRLVAAVGNGPVTKCCLWTKTGSFLASRPAFDIAVAPLPGFGKLSAGFAF